LNFSSFGFSPSIMEGIEAIGYETATPVQETAIPAILQGNDIIASAQTGTGKTAAFLLPVIEKLSALPHDNKVKAMVIVPTRELALQIDQQMEGFSYYTRVSSIAIYGGTDGTVFSREKQALTEGADLIVCTPGRLMAHMNMGYITFPELKFLILDEADRMLDMGFSDDILKIISYLPKERQTLMFSATMPTKIRHLARQILKNPLEISIAISKPAEKILQKAYVVYDTQKIPLIKMLLKETVMKKVLIFCSTKEKTRQLYHELKKTGIRAEEIHSTLEQAAREKVIIRFKSGDIPVLVATDIVSRGIDIEDIDMVINYDVPHDAEDYIHRIGRTARASAEGTAVTFINERDMQRFGAIETLLERVVEKSDVPEVYGETPVYNPNLKIKGEKRNFGGKRKGGPGRGGAGNGGGGRRGPGGGGHGR
jgi:ATP-dependent RNA helicase RhlE